MDKIDLPFRMVGRMMHEMLKAFKKRIGEKADIKITMEQFGLLHMISSEEYEVIQQDLANVMGKDKSSILRIIDSLEDKDLVRRVVDANDRRKNCLMVTKKGERVITQYSMLEAEFMKEVLEGLTAAEMEIFYKVVSHLKNKAEQL
jgi:MarR family transcriptional regulator, transcriptional regulator for hemolysin